MTETLAEKKCTPCRGGIAPLTHEEAERFRLQTPNWELGDDGHRIERTFRLSNFRQALGFVAEVGDLAETESHHPDISFGWATRPSRCEPRKSRDCTRTILSWQARSIGYLPAGMTLPIISEIATPAHSGRGRSCCHDFPREGFP
jgi:4a-hydroxytetrahydrobiopterin dehydratase